MRVLHIAPSLVRAFGGPTRSLAGFVRAARAVGIEPTVAAPECPRTDRVAFEQDAGPVEIRGFRTYGRGAFVVAPGLWRWLSRAGGDYDVVHVHGLLSPVSSLSARVALERDWPLVVRPFGTLSRYTFEHRRGRLKRSYFRHLDGPNLRRAGAIHFTTTAERDQAGWHGIEFGGRAHVVSPCVRAAPFAAESSPAAAPLALFISRIHPVKNLEALLAAWPLVVAEVPDARLVIAGDGEARYVRAVRARARGLEGSVRFAGFVAGAEKDRLLAEARAFVLPSHHENLGFAVLEAVAAGVPVVITPEVQVSSFVAENGLGVVTPAQPAVLARALVRVLRDDALARVCRERGPALVAERFSDRAVAAGLAAMYTAAITSTPFERT